MFDIPLFIDRASLYSELGVPPESLADEIREAKTEVSAALDVERAALDNELRGVEAVVPGLADARRDLRNTQANATARPEALTAARERLAEAEVRALTANPRYREILRRLEDVDRRKIRINQITIDNPEARQVHDRAHPPLGLLKIEDAARDAFVDNRTAISLLRRDLSRFLTERGEEVFYPSDLHRENFVADITPNSLLDES
jgi:hypothetical protein